MAMRRRSRNIEDLIEEINELVQHGDLDATTANGLLAKLNAAIRSLEKGNAIPATNELGAFINAVEAAIQTGKIDAEDGEYLIEEVEEIIGGLEVD